MDSTLCQLTQTLTLGNALGHKIFCRLIRRERLLATTGWGAAGVGTAVPATPARWIGTTTPRTPGATASVSGWCAPEYLLK